MHAPNPARLLIAKNAAVLLQGVLQPRVLFETSFNCTHTQHRQCVNRWPSSCS